MKKIVEIIHKWLAISDFKYRDKSKIQLSLDLIDEEIKELKEAVATNNKQEVLDAYADIIYVLNNLTYFYGLTPEEIEEYFNKVTVSNYSKFSDDMIMMIISSELYEKGEHPLKMGEKIEAEVVNTHNLEYPFVIRNKITGKILKPISFKEPKDV